jgi:hypothetical protein
MRDRDAFQRIAVMRPEASCTALAACLELAREALSRAKAPERLASESIRN